MTISSVSLQTIICSTTFSHKLAGDDKKALCQLLGKLHIPDKVDDDKIRTLNLLMNNLRIVCACSC